MPAAPAKRPATLPHEAADLADQIACHIALAAQAGSDFVEHACKAGQLLENTIAKKAIPHGLLLDFYARIGIDKRRAQELRQLANLADANARAGALLADCTSIKAAIKALLPPKPTATKKKAKARTIPPSTVPLTSPVAPGVVMRLGEDELRAAFEAAGLQKWIATIPADQRKAAIELLKAPVIETKKIGDEFVDARALRH